MDECMLCVYIRMKDGDVYISSVVACVNILCIILHYNELAKMILM
jgi:hypothetical protein